MSGRRKGAICRPAASVSGDFTLKSTRSAPAIAETALLATSRTASSKVFVSIRRPAGFDRLHMLRPGDQRHGVAGAGQHAAEVAADGAGAHHGDLQGESDRGILTAPRKGEIAIISRYELLADEVRARRCIGG